MQVVLRNDDRTILTIPFISGSRGDGEEASARRAPGRGGDPDPRNAGSIPVGFGEGICRQDCEYAPEGQFECGLREEGS